jgi:hypothetical protein
MNRRTRASCLSWVPLAIAILACLCTIPAYAAEKQPPLHEQEFGTAAGEPIARGIVFIDGRYLAPPYTVSRKGLGIFVNDTLALRPVTWPQAKPLPGKEDPKLPEEVSKHSSTRDRVLKEYLDKKYAYIRTNHPKKDHPRLLEALYRSLPCVKGVAIDKEQPDILTTTNYHGTESRVPLHIPDPPATLTREDVTRQLESIRVRIEADLKEGHYYLCFGDGSVSGPHALEDISLILSVAAAVGNPGSKANRLREMLGISKSWGLTFFENFKESPPLKEHIKKLAEQKRKARLEEERKLRASVTPLCHAPRAVLFPALKQFLNTPQKPDPSFVKVVRLGRTLPAFASTPEGWTNWNKAGLPAEPIRTLRIDADGFRMHLKICSVMRRPDRSIADRAARDNRHPRVILMDHLFEGATEVTRVATLGAGKGHVTFGERRYYEDYASEEDGKFVCVHLTVSDQPKESRILDSLLEFLKKHYPKYLGVCKAVSDRLKKSD